MKPQTARSMVKCGVLGARSAIWRSLWGGSRRCLADGEPKCDAEGMASADFAQVFDRLRAIMSSHAEAMVVVRDEPGDYYLNTRHVRHDGYVFAFGAVQIKKRYVSYHLMPIQSTPDLLGASDALRARMQGKACFNFTRVEEALFAELDRATGLAADAVDGPAFLPQ